MDFKTLRAKLRKDIKDAPADDMQVDFLMLGIKMLSKLAKTRGELEKIRETLKEIHIALDEGERGMILHDAVYEE